jgi:arsenate reductase (thioredoxin)
MAEAFLNSLGAEKFEAESAGLESGTLNPVVIEAMKEADIDISGYKTKGIHDFLQQGKTYDYVITVCDEASAGRCPTFPGQGQKLYWDFPDPSRFAGTHEEKLARTRVVRDQINAQIEQWIKNQ